MPGGGRESTNPTGGSSKNEGSHGTIAASASGVTFDRSKNGSGPAAGPVAAAGNWTPPACWYAPKYTAAQFKAYEEPIWEAESTGPEWDAQQRKRYVDGSPYKNFNLSKADDGYWWTSFPNENFPLVGTPATSRISGWTRVPHRPTPRQYPLRFLRTSPMPRSEFQVPK